MHANQGGIHPENTSFQITQEKHSYQATRGLEAQGLSHHPRPLIPQEPQPGSTLQQQVNRTMSRRTVSNQPYQQYQPLNFLSPTSQKPTNHQAINPKPYRYVPRACAETRPQRRMRLATSSNNFEEPRMPHTRVKQTTEIWCGQHQDSDRAPKKQRLRLHIPSSNTDSSSQSGSTTAKRGINVPIDISDITSTVHFSPASDRTNERISFLISVEVLSEIHLLSAGSCPTRRTYLAVNLA